jgi:hypothetical protein
MFLILATLAEQPMLTEQHVATNPSSLSQSQLDEISARCHTPLRWLQKRHGAVHIRPPKTAKYEQVDCLLAALRGPERERTGFIGNERPD